MLLSCFSKNSGHNFRQQENYFKSSCNFGFLFIFVYLFNVNHNGMLHMWPYIVCVCVCGGVGGGWGGGVARASPQKNPKYMFFIMLVINYQYSQNYSVTILACKAPVYTYFSRMFIVCNTQQIALNRYSTSRNNLALQCI